MADSVTTARIERTLPWILGLYALAGATFVVAAHMAHWYGTAQSAWYLAPFVALLGGLAQFLAGMWAYRAEDGLGTARCWGPGARSGWATAC